MVHPKTRSFGVFWFIQKNNRSVLYPEIDLLTGTLIGGVQEAKDSCVALRQDLDATNKQIVSLNKQIVALQKDIKKLKKAAVK